MRIYEIEGWDEGTKITKTDWTKGKYITLEKDGYDFICKNEKGNELALFNRDIFVYESWELYQEPEELIEKKFYRAINKCSGHFLDKPYTKNHGHIANYYFRQFDEVNCDLAITTELVYLAYFKKGKDQTLKVVRYVLASGEVIEV